MKKRKRSGLLLATFAILGAGLGTVGCSDGADVLKPAETVLNKGGGSGGGGGSVRYQLRFIVEDETQGEITSGFFPAAGVQLNAKDPWKNLSISGADWTFNNHTNGTRGEGSCTVATDVDVNWEIAGTDPVRTFVGNWHGTVSLWRQGNYMNFYFEGARPDNAAAVIQNIASNANRPAETSASDGSWYRIRFTSARLGFGSRSSPDGEGTVADLPGYESACANFTIEAVRMP